MLRRARRRTGDRCGWRPRAATLRPVHGSHATARRLLLLVVLTAVTAVVPATAHAVTQPPRQARHVPAEEARCDGPLRRAHRQAVRAKRGVLGAEPEPPEDADHRVPDLERAEPPRLLAAAPERAPVRGDAAGRHAPH